MPTDPSSAVADPPTLRRRVGRSRVRLRLALLGLGLVVIPPGAWVASRMAGGNFGVIREGREYRSGQLSGPALGRAVATYRIKTVLNLRGPSPKAAWHAAERAAALDGGATHVDIALSSCEWMSREQARALLDVLETAERPLLIHCQWGSERTGLVSAFLELLRPGGSLEAAENQFRLHYLYVPFGDGIVMERHLAQYKGWLAAHSLPHTPDRFRHWLIEEFRPGVPSREAWPWDPFPMVVTATRPTG